MFHALYQSLYDPEGSLSFLRLFYYITSRAMFASVTAFLISIIVGRKGITSLFMAGATDQARDYGVVDVSSKRGTPTMGGILVVFATLITVLLWCDLTNRFVQILTGALLWFALIGIVDDVQKSKHKDPDRGMSRWPKFLLQVLFGLGVGVLLYHPSTSPLPGQLRSVLQVPFLKAPVADIWWVSILWTALIITFAANAVNFADGLDGLAIVPAFFVAAVYGVFAYVLGNQVHSAYLQFVGIPGAGEIAIFCLAFAGAALGFLWYNAYPAEVFMGDSGSLPLGGVLGTMSHPSS